MVMFRNGVCGLLILVGCACDPAYVIRSTRELPATPTQECVLGALRAQVDVREAGMSPQGQMFADAVLPSEVRRPSDSGRINIDLVRKGDCITEVRLSAYWLGDKPDEELRTRWQRELDE